jgi:membrane fusion protein, multidrug efflux system
MSTVASSEKKWWATPRAKKVEVGSGITILILLVVWFFFFHPYVSTDDARIATTMVRVSTRGNGGPVMKLNVEEGSRVKAGDVLIELDHSIVEAQLERAKAHADVTAKELVRVRALAQQHGAPIRDLDTATAAATTAKAEMQLAQTAFDDTYIKSPINGIVVQKNIEEGNLLQTGQVALVVSDIDNAYVTANIEETKVADVKVGQKVFIHVDEGGDLTGKVVDVRDAAASQFALIPSDNAAGNFTKLVQRIPVKITLDPHAQVLRTGQSVEIKILVR